MMAEEDAPAARQAVALAPGTELRIEFGDRHGRRRSFEALVQESTEHRLVVVPLAAQRGIALPDAGARVHLHLLRERGSAVARVVSRGAPDAPVELTRPMRLVRESRRRLFRIDVLLDARSSLGPVRVVNLSGGGCLLALPDGAPSPAIEASVDLALALPGLAQPLPVRGRVVRIFQPEAGGPRVGLDFGRLASRDESLIIRYVFARQAELLRRGLLTAPERDV